MPEVRQVWVRRIIPIVGVEDVATCGRPASESDQERFEHKLMNEPYLLRKQQRKGRRNKQQEGKGKDTTQKEERSNRDENCKVIPYAGSRLFTQ